MPKWFRRLAEIPGVGYPASDGVVRSKLKGHSAVPQVTTYNFDGRKRQVLSWPSGSSASPAHEWGFSPDTSSTAAALKRLAEALELPGIPSDYHFAIQHCLEFLYKQRREEPWQLREVERLAWLDVRLIEACPESIRFGDDLDDKFVHALAFGRLIDLYVNEGLMREAVDVAERAARFAQGGIDLEELRERLAHIESENV
jgi:hypothetical protein